MTILLESIVGSQAYGLATPTSDTDTLGIYVQPTEDFHGLKVFTERDFSRVTKEPDRTLHEVGKFCRLALQCNPTVTELLWVPERLLVTTSVQGEALRNARMSFVSAKLVRSAYMGYADAQFHRLSERGNNFSSDTKNRTQKHARHLARLMHQGFTLWSTGELPIVLDDPGYYHWFGEMVEQDPNLAKRSLEKYRDMFDSTPTVLPETADYARIDRLVKWVRSSF